jgi:hypothetical protein
MLSKLTRIVQPCLALVLGGILFFWQRLSSFLPLDRDKILGITIALWAGLIFYFDRRFDKLLPGNRVLNHINISQGIHQALSYVKKPRIIRIFAFSTYVIQPILRDSGVRIPQCSILFYQSCCDKEEGPQHGAPGSRVQPAPIGEWFNMQKAGQIGNLEIKGHDFYPQIYFVIFDDRALLMGHYLIHDQTFPRCEFQEPCLIVDASTEGKIMIQKCLRLFEALRTSKRAQPVSAARSASSVR